MKSKTVTPPPGPPQKPLRAEAPQSEDKDEGGVPVGAGEGAGDGDVGGGEFAGEFVEVVGGEAGEEVAVGFEAAEFVGGEVGSPAFLDGFDDLALGLRRRARDYALAFGGVPRFTALNEADRLSLSLSLCLPPLCCVLGPSPALGQGSPWVAEMSTAPDGLVSLAWPARGGYGYRLETSPDLADDSWQPLAIFHGTGGTLSIPVARIPLPGAQPPPPAPPVDLRSAHFVLRTFAGLNKTLVAWNQPGQSGLSQVLLNADFSSIVNLPLFFGKFEDPANATDYLLIDGFSDGEEFAAGSDPHDANSTPANHTGGPPGSDLPPDEDQDGDTLPNALDADPLDIHVDWERRPFPQFVALPIPNSGGLVPAAVNNKGEVVLNAEETSPGGPSIARHWKPGMESPVALKLGAEPESPLTLAPRLFAGYDAVGKPLAEATTLTLTDIIARDINDQGVIVGEGRFVGPSPGTTGTGGSTPALGPSVTIALQWDNAGAAPSPVHPGFADMTQPGHNWGDLLLDSAATNLNESGMIVGHAEYRIGVPGQAPPFLASPPAPNYWSPTAIGGEGASLYDPAEIPIPAPTITGLHRVNDAFTGGTGDSSAAYWDVWTETPAHVFPEAGVTSVGVATVPNGREAIAGDRRLMLRNHYGILEPALRTYGNGFAVTESGTVWFIDQTSSPWVPSLWNPMESGAVSSRTTPQPLAVSRIVDVASKDVAIAESSAGNVLLLPVGTLVTRNSIQAPQPLDDWRFARDLRVAKFGGGDLLATAEDVLVRFDHEDDPDRFRVAVFGLPEDLPVQVSIGTRNLPQFTAYDDNATAASLIWDPAIGGYATASMLLVTDDVDDGYPGSGIGADDVAEDRSHRIAAGGRLRIEQLKIASDPPRDVLADIKLANYGSVSITVYPVKAGTLPPFTNYQQEIENDIARTRERLAQVGISLNVTVADLQTFPGTVNVAGSSIPLDLADGLEFNSGQADTPELSAFLTHAASIASETALRVFYISDLVGEIPAFGDRVPPGFAVSEGPFENIVVICRRKEPFVLAHELCHRLTDSGSHDFDANNLMRPSPHDGSKIDDPKRLTDAQHSAIITSTLLDAP